MIERQGDIIAIKIEGAPDKKGRILMRQKNFLEEEMLASKIRLPEYEFSMRFSLSEWNQLVNEILDGRFS